MALEPPATVAFDIAAEPPPLDTNRSELGMAEAREVLRGDLIQAIEHFVYVALLAHPDTRAVLAPSLSPDDLPSQVPRELNLPVATRDDWRKKLFDDQNRLVVTSPYKGWGPFLGWVQAVNPTIQDQVSDLTSPAFRGLT